MTHKKEIKEECLYLPVEVLCSTAEYQRPLNEKFIERKIKEFDPYKVEVIKVSFRDGAYQIIDGQHTTEIVRRHYAPKEAHVWAKVYYDLTYEDEARLFAAQRNERPLSAYEQFRGLLESNDETALLLIQICKAYGFRMGYTSGDHTFGSPSVIQRIYKLYGEQVLCSTLCRLETIWGGRKVYLKCSFVVALAKIISIYGDSVDDQILGHLSKIPMSTFIAEADRLSPRKRDFAAAIVSLYNEKTKKKLNTQAM